MGQTMQSGILIALVLCQPPVCTYYLRSNHHFSTKFRTDQYRKFKGRPVLVHDSHQIILNRVDASLRRTRTDDHDHREQYLVHSLTNNRADVQNVLRSVSDYVSYIPHDTFSVLLSLKDLDRVLSMIERSNVEFFKLPFKMKISPEIHQFNLLDKPSRGRSAGCVSSQLILLLTDRWADLPPLREQIDALCLNSTNSETRICRISPGSPASKKLVVDTDTCSLWEAAHRFSAQPEILWVGVQRTKQLSNKYATRIAQSANGTSWMLWSYGLRGEGEVNQVSIWHSKV